MMDTRDWVILIISAIAVYYLASYFLESGVCGMIVQTIVVVILVVAGLALAGKHFAHGVRSIEEWNTLAKDVEPGHMTVLTDGSTDPIHEIAQSVLAILVVGGCMAIIALVPSVPAAIPAGFIGVVVGYYFK